MTKKAETDYTIKVNGMPNYANIPKAVLENSRKRRRKFMEDVRNGCDKLVCRIDKSERLVEIVMKGYKTTICFKSDGTVEIKNAQTA